MNFLLRLMATLGLNATNYHVGLKRADSAASAFSQSVKRKFIAAFGVAAITAFTAKIINAADEIVDMGGRLDMSTDKLQEWIYAAKKSGATAETLTGFFENLARAREKALGGDDATFGAFEKLGVSAAQLRGGNRDEIARQIGKAFEGGNIQDLLPSLNKVGGKAAGALIPAFAEGIDALSKSAHKAGQVLDQTVLTKLKQIKKEVLDLNDIANSQGGKAISRFGLPAVQMFADVLKLNIKTLQNLGAGKGVNSISDAWSDIKKERHESNMAMWNQRRIMMGLTDSIAPSRASLFPKKGGGGISEYTQHDALKMAGLRAILPTGDKPQLNEWQRLGAATRGQSAGEMKIVADNTRKTVERLEAIIKLNRGNFGAQQIF